MIAGAALLWSLVLLAGGPDLRVGLHAAAVEVAIAGEVMVARGGVTRTVTNPVLRRADAPCEVSAAGETISVELRTVAGRAVAARRYRGRLLLQGAGQRLAVVNAVTLEDYLRGVVPLEIGPGAPPAALQAQAVAARSYALARRGDGQREGADFQVARTQAYLGSGPETAATDAAVAATAGQLLVVDERPVEAVYSACCGGLAASAEEVWGGPIAGLRPGFRLPAGQVWSDARLRQLLAADASPCRGGVGYRWTRTVDLARLPGRPTAAAILRRGPSGRVLELRLQTPKGPETLRADAIRNRLAQPAPLPSLLFTMTVAGRQLKLEGGGWGHGIGLCQAGTIGLAKAGLAAPEILARYYPSATLTPPVE